MGNFAGRIYVVFSKKIGRKLTSFIGNQKLFDTSKPIKKGRDYDHKKYLHFLGYELGFSFSVMDWPKKFL